MGQDVTKLTSEMAATLGDMSSEMRFKFEDTFDETLPEVIPKGNAAANIESAQERAAVKNLSMNLFIDTSTSLQWETEFAEGMSTCVRPSHPIYSTKLNRYINVHEMALCQGIFKNDFESPEAVSEFFECQADGQDIVGNAFASTCAQAQVLASLVNSSGWLHLQRQPETVDVLTPGNRPSRSFVRCNTDSLESVTSTMSTKSQPLDDTQQSSQIELVSAPSVKRKLRMDDYVTPVPTEKRARFLQAPAASPVHEV